MTDFISFSACDNVYVRLCVFVGLIHTADAIELDCIQNPLTVCASAGTQAWRALTQERTSKLMLFRIEQEPDLSASKAHSQSYSTLCLIDTPDSLCLPPPKQFEHMEVASTAH